MLLYVIALARPIAPLINYSVNYGYISEVLCENTDKPELACNGQCYLNQQFQNIADSDSDESPALTIQWEDYPIGFVESVDYDYRVKKSGLNSQYAETQDKVRAPFVNDIPVPPWNVI